MRIEIWSDVVCPWCYIGKRRLETALTGFEGRDEVEIRWRSFQLDPGAPQVPTESVAEHLGRKYGGGPAAGTAMIDRTEAVAAEEGLVYRLREAKRANTLDAHRLLHLALREGGVGPQGELKEGLLSAYFTQARNTADHDVLVDVALSAGLDESRVRGVLASDEFADDVWSDVALARRYGATGVPFFVVDERYGVSGAQPAELFRELLDKAWAESRPSLQMVATGEECGPDGCPV